ncbi:hypothetical protein [Streptomyces sp. NPDC060002]|uniref:hypothetical protein n=1 Tax=Streptomyces sp. NPDC060002 TaxID=3347033 RepID=UPI0036B4351C
MGVIVLTAASQWAVTHTSYLTRPDLVAKPSLQAPPGKSPTLTVNGTPAGLTRGTTCSGSLALTVAQSE